MAYSTTARVQGFLKRELTDDEIDILSIIIPAVKIWIDKKLGSTFDKAGATTRIYDGGTSTIDIDPCTSISVVKSLNDDGTDSYDYSASTEYIAEPVNEVVKREIRRRSGCFPNGASRIAVTAKFSEYVNGVPEDIQLVATRIAGSLIEAANNVGNVQSESLEGHSVSYSTASMDKIAIGDPIILGILEQRKQILVG